MKLSRDWINDYVDLSDISDDDLARRFTEIGHAVESMETHGDDTVFDLEITTNRVDAMSHLGMARELAAATGRELRGAPGSPPAGTAPSSAPITIRIDAPEMCARYTALPIRDVAIRPSSPKIQRRLEAVGLRPINNVVDVTNYVMLTLGHPLHAFDLDKLAQQTIIVRRGARGETMKSLDGETRKIDEQTVVIADAQRGVALGGIIGGFDSEITAATKNVLLECAWFDPSTIRRTAKRLGLKTDASYRFERRVDPSDTIDAASLAAEMIVELAGGTREAVIDVVAESARSKTIRLRASKLHEQSGGAVGAGYALDLFRRLGFSAEPVHDGIVVTVPTYRGDLHEEMDLVEEVLRFFGLNNVPAELPRLTTGDVRREESDVIDDLARDVLVACGATEVMNYAFVHPEWNSAFAEERPVAVANALTENISSMRLSLIPGMLETVVFNRSYGTRDGVLFEVGRTYLRDDSGVPRSSSGSLVPREDAEDLRGTPRNPRNSVIERHRIAIVLYGSVGAHWGDAKRAVDFFDVKGIVEQIAAKLHVPLTFRAADQQWLRKGKRSAAYSSSGSGDRKIADAGFLAAEVLQKFGVKGDVVAAEIDVDALIASSTKEWRMTQVARFPGVPMILAITHGRDLDYQRVVDAIRSFDIPHLHEVGLRDRFSAEGEIHSVKTTLGMWYQAFDRSLTQDEVAVLQQQLAQRLAAALPVKVL
jgi:phenylalanyl-tRNA synthetase beta chain